MATRFSSTPRSAYILPGACARTGVAVAAKTASMMAAIVVRRLIRSPALGMRKTLPVGRKRGSRRARSYWSEIYHTDKKITKDDALGPPHGAASFNRPMSGCGTFCTDRRRTRRPAICTGAAAHRSICSAIVRASSTSIPRYRTVLSNFVWPSSSGTARRFPVRR